jgi:ABC-type dipeptide/oligopeptide/nickel transport system permease subunit
MAMLFAAGPGFLGLGARPPRPEWGVMLSAGRDYLRIALHVATFPGLAIMLVVLGFNLLNGSIRDWDTGCTWCSPPWAHARYGCANVAWCDLGDGLRDALDPRLKGR